MPTPLASAHVKLSINNITVVDPQNSNASNIPINSTVYIIHIIQQSQIPADILLEYFPEAMVNSIEPRPALLAVDHPMNHTQTFKEAKPKSFEEKVNYLYERRQVEDLLNTYGYILDSCMVKNEAADVWADLFTEDCELTYPFGTHKTKEGLAKWCLQAETRFKRMAVRIGCPEPDALSC